MAQRGSNAFSCLISRRAGGMFPVCWDAEGARALLPLDFDDARMRLSGKSGGEIEAMVAQRFKSGEYRPRRERALPTCWRRCGTGSTKQGTSHGRHRILI